MAKETRIMKLDDLASPSYRAQLHQMHSDSDWGKRGQQHISSFITFFYDLGCKTLLDYGCGKGTMRPVLHQIDASIDVRLFDPGHEPVSALPEPADFVTALSCIENIEPELVDNVLSHIHSLTSKGAYLAITIRSSNPKKPTYLPDGRDEHLSVHPPAWWLEKLSHYDWHIHKHELHKKAVRVWLRK
jgi:hypothetical protein